MADEPISLYCNYFILINFYFLFLFFSMMNHSPVFFVITHSTTWVALLMIFLKYLLILVASSILFRSIIPSEWLLQYNDTIITAWIIYSIFILPAFLLGGLFAVFFIILIGLILAAIVAALIFLGVSPSDMENFEQKYFFWRWSLSVLVVKIN